MTVIPGTQQRVFVDALKSDLIEITKQVPQGRFHFGTSSFRFFFSIWIDDKLPFTPFTECNFYSSNECKLFCKKK